MSMQTLIQNVLIIDDDPILCEVLRTFFEMHSVARVSVAENGVEAKQVLDDNAGKIDLISCDLNMPDADGIEFLHYLETVGSEIPVIIISSAHDTVIKSADKLAQIYNLNLIGTLKKPVNTEKLEIALSGYLKT